jgi:hypothetical protein
MRPISSALALCAALAGAATTASAQACLGFASFASGGVRVGANATFDDNVTTLGPNLAFGAPASGPFAGVGVDFADYDGTEEGAVIVRGQVGTQTRFAPTSRAQFCPVASVAYRSGPNTDGRPDVNQSGLAFDAGVSLGAPLALSTGVDLVPFGGVALSHQRATREVGDVDRTTSETGATIDLGAGLVFARRFTTRLGVAVPVGFEGQDPRFNFGFGINF